MYNISSEDLYIDILIYWYIDQYVAWTTLVLLKTLLKKSTDFSFLGVSFFCWTQRKLFSTVDGHHWLPQSKKYCGG